MRTRTGPLRVALTLLAGSATALVSPAARSADRVVFVASGRWDNTIVLIDLLKGGRSEE